jgi:hypothetical protein
MFGLRMFVIILLHLSAGFALLLSLDSSATSAAFTVPWEPVAVVFGASLGYTVVLGRRPRRLRGGAYFILAGITWLVAAMWVRSVVTDTARPLLLFVSAGMCLTGALLADDMLGGVLHRATSPLVTRPWSGSLIVGGACGLLVGGADLLLRRDPTGAALIGLICMVGTSLLYRLTIAATADRPASFPGRSARDTGRGIVDGR